MILLARRTSETQKTLEVIVRRLPVTHSEYSNYCEHVRRLKAGFAGEQRVDAEWLELDLPSPYYFLHDFQTMNDFGSTHQMDTIFLCRQFLLILEIKNITGILSYDALFAQFTRTTGEGNLEGMTDPFLQLERHVVWMKRLLQREHFHLPVLHAVVLATKNGILSEGFQGQPIFHVTGLRVHLQKWLDLHQPVETEKLFRFARVLMSMHKKVKRAVKVPFEDMVKGVICPKCANGQPMSYSYKKWHCPRCGLVDRDALKRDLEDYRLLVGPKLTNKSFREFFAIDSPNVAYKLLQQLPLKAEGSKKHREYWMME
ncbi:nuclease-related domain-containing protein [Lysinibacillus sp. ZYM-1]|uniref:nuclease-related domain-containing protein n=1 Tax=Lysinibacillus sp. ZYM-1 TaxID=1681184 RepID=UPI0006CE921C|nr:nuclease-related domain-containing protein [Lysinibacillus sp. ZYM-1]KPN94789.1 hypothetical protein AO843_04620 [Lysinibacillus sp. ZYM-1]